MFDNDAHTVLYIFVEKIEKKANKFMEIKVIVICLCVTIIYTKYSFSGTVHIPDIVCKKTAIFYCNKYFRKKPSLSNAICCHHETRAFVQFYEM